VALLTNPTVVKLCVRAMRRLLGGGGSARVSFPEIPGRTRVLAVPTRFGTTTTTVYEPAGGSAGAPPVHVNFHGGGYVVGD
jgi:acetyl esterase/lipase